MLSGISPPRAPLLQTSSLPHYVRPRLQPYTTFNHAFSVLSGIRRAVHTLVYSYAGVSGQAVLPHSVPPHPLHIYSVQSLKRKASDFSHFAFRAVANTPFCEIVITNIITLFLEGERNIPKRPEGLRPCCRHPFGVPPGSRNPSKTHLKIHPGKSS